MGRTSFLGLYVMKSAFSFLGNVAEQRWENEEPKDPELSNPTEPPATFPASSSFYFHWAGAIEILIQILLESNGRIRHMSCMDKSIWHAWCPFLNWRWTMDVAGKLLLKNEMRRESHNLSEPLLRDAYGLLCRRMCPGERAKRAQGDQRISPRISQSSLF